MTTATYDVGYGSSRAVYEQAGRHLGMTPGAYRRGGAGERIRAVVTPTPFGQLLVAATDRGVCRVMLGDDAGALEADLAAEFPRAELAGADAGLRAHVAAIRRQLASGDEDGPPVDVGGTAFEQPVWRALRAIPYGEVRSYQQVAQRLAGRPRRGRWRRLRRHPVALVVPVPSRGPADGESGGYRWGADRRRPSSSTSAGRAAAAGAPRPPDRGRLGEGAAPAGALPSHSCRPLPAPCSSPSCCRLPLRLRRRRTRPAPESRNEEDPG